MQTAQEVLAQLDHHCKQFNFPALDNGYIYPADVRLSVFRDGTDWLMIIEHLGVNPRAGDFGSIQNCLYLFGSQLHRSPGLANEDILYPVAAWGDAKVFDEEYGWELVADAHRVLVSGRAIELDLSDAALKRKGMGLKPGEAKDAATLTRSLLPEHRDLLLASEAHLAARNPRGLPLWIRLEEWHHPDVISGEPPSKSETFQMLAAAIASGDKSKYHPTKAPNTHWKNWPDGGTL